METRIITQEKRSLAEDKDVSILNEKDIEELAKFFDLLAQFDSEDNPENQNTLLNQKELKRFISL